MKKEYRAMAIKIIQRKKYDWQGKFCAIQLSRTITSGQKTVYNNSSLSFWTRRYDIGLKIIGKNKCNKFIICFAYFVLLKYAYNWENVAILGQKVPAQEVKHFLVSSVSTL